MPNSKKVPNHAEILARGDIDRRLEKKPEYLQFYEAVSKIKPPVFSKKESDRFMQLISQRTEKDYEHVLHLDDLTPEQLAKLSKPWSEEFKNSLRKLGYKL